MRPTQLLALSGLMLASNVVLAAELDRDDVPNRCWDVCGPVVGVAHRCDGMHKNDRAEMDCICDWKQAPSLVPLCEACIADYRADRNSPNRDRHYDEEHDLFDDDDDDDDADDRDPHHNDAYDILRSCSFSTTSYNSAAATSALSNTASATGSGSTTGSTTVSSTGSSARSTSTDSSNGGNGGSGGSSNDSSGSATNSAGSAQTTDNAAAGSSAPQAASLAAIVGLGFVAWL